MTDDKTRRAIGKLQQSKSKLDTLLNITNAINDNSSEEYLFSILKSILTKNLNIAKLALFTFDSKKWKVSISEGIDKSVCEKINVSTLIDSFKDIGIINQDKTSPSLSKFDIAIPVFHEDRPLAFALLADIEGEKMEISPIIKHLRFIQTLINIIVVALENKRLNKQEVKQASINKELELARSMQTLLFPKSLPNSSTLKVTALYMPHSEVGGDYYDVIPLPDGKTAFCIADVSGKGISAALLMANFQANLRALIRIANNLEDLIELCNQKIIESANFEKFITLFIGIFDPTKKELSYVNCGHQPPLLLQNKKVQQLKNGTTILGMFEKLPSLKTGVVSIDKKDMLVCFTDGLTEMSDEKGNQLEGEGIASILKHKKNISEVKDSLTALILQSKTNIGLDDDITFLAAQFL
jgi:sigma-B regulation protein RsbU (phosphoserine phosphatase)